MSAKVSGLVWDLNLPANKKLVLLAMADHADHEGRNIFPSMGLVAHKTGYSKRQVQRIVKELVGDGVLSEQKRIGETTLFSIHIENGVKNLPYRSTDESAAIDDVTPDKLSWGGVTNCHGGGDIAMSPEPSFKKEKELQEPLSSSIIEFPARPEYVIQYEQNIGAATPLILDELTRLNAEYNPEWLLLAFQIAVSKERRNLAYVRGVLKNWKANGFNAPTELRQPDAQSTPAAQWEHDPNCPKCKSGYIQELVFDEQGNVIAAKPPIRCDCWRQLPPDQSKSAAD